jgi:L-amino acid N-acyltransferase YncA
MVTIRAATVQDAEQIAHVHIDSWRTTYAGIVPDEYLLALNETKHAAFWQERLKLGTEVYIAVQIGKIIGFISGGPIRKPLESYDAELYAIYLLKQAQIQGIGTNVLKELAKSLISKGFSSMLVWVLERNPSRRFYERSGALSVTSKEIEIGGTMLTEVAYGWPDLKTIGSPK